MYAIRSFGALLLVTLPVVAQSVASTNVINVEHSVPFGTVTGKLLLLGNNLVFLDEQQMGSSFVVPKSIIDNLSAEGQIVTVQSREPIRGRSGDATRLSFRVLAGSDPASVTSWYGSGMPASRSSSSGAPEASGPSYQARHDHRVGSCRGRLIVTPNQLVYESVENVGHSRRWEYGSIKELKNSNPYKLEVKPSAGGDYEFVLEGTGMDPAGYKNLVDRVTAARAGSK